MRLPILSLVVAVCALTGARKTASAQSAYSYPWCAKYYGKLEGTSCYYRSYQQCMATVSGVSEDGESFEEQAAVRDISVQGAYLSLNSRPRLQSEIRVVIEAAGEQNRPAALALRATVVHCTQTRDEGQTGVGVFFIEDAEAESPRD